MLEAPRVDATAGVPPVVAHASRQPRCTSASSPGGCEASSSCTPPQFVAHFFAHVSDAARHPRSQVHVDREAADEAADDKRSLLAMELEVASVSIDKRDSAAEEPLIFELDL